MNDTDVRRFFALVDADGDCWLWTGTASGRGYGVFQVAGRQRRAHRVSWEHLVGPIPDGLVLDHLCRNKLCINPDHLEPVSNRENVLRGYGITAQCSRKTECPKGHPLSGDNLIMSGNARRCGICTRTANRARKQRLSAAFLADGTGAKHSLHGYTLGCRCDVCRRAYSEYARARRIARKQT